MVEKSVIVSVRKNIKSPHRKTNKMVLSVVLKW